MCTGKKSLSTVTLLGGGKKTAHIECICLVADIGVTTKKGPLLWPAFII